MDEEELLGPEWDMEMSRFCTQCNKVRDGTLYKWRRELWWVCSVCRFEDDLRQEDDEDGDDWYHSWLEKQLWPR